MMVPLAAPILRLQEWPRNGPVVQVQALPSSPGFLSRGPGALAAGWAPEQDGAGFWYSYLFKNIPQFVVIYTVKDFSIVNEAEIYVILVFSYFFFSYFFFSSRTSLVAQLVKNLPAVQETWV